MPYYEMFVLGPESKLNIRATGGNGGNGGNALNPHYSKGANGGDGGRITLTVKERDMDLLLLLNYIDVSGG